MSSPQITRKEEWDAISREFYAYFLEWIKTNGTSVDEIETYELLEGVKSLPARLELGGVRKNVLIPLSTLSAHTDNSAEAANEAANKANLAATKATNAADEAKAAANNANSAIVDLENEKAQIAGAVENANQAAERIREIVDHPPKIGENKNWWIWSEEKSAYVDSGVIAEGNFMYSTLMVDPDTMHLMLYAPKEMKEPLFELDQETGHLYLLLKIDS